MLKLERNRKKKRKEYGKASLSRDDIRLASNRRLCKLLHLYRLNTSDLTNAISEPPEGKLGPPLLRAEAVGRSGARGTAAKISPRA
jgi:hypothetical protein